MPTREPSGYQRLPLIPNPDIARAPVCRRKCRCLGRRTGRRARSDPCSNGICGFGGFRAHLPLPPVLCLRAGAALRGRYKLSRYAATVRHNRRCGQALLNSKRRLLRNCELAKQHLVNGPSRVPVRSLLPAAQGGGTGQGRRAQGRRLHGQVMAQLVMIIPTGGWVAHG